MLEPCDAKVSSTVLRGPGDRKVAWLLGKNEKGFICGRLFGALVRFAISGMSNAGSARSASYRLRGPQDGAYIIASLLRRAGQRVLKTAFYFIQSAMTGFTVSAFLSRNRVSPKEAFEGLELCERKLSCTVLRGLDGSNPVRLLDYWLPPVQTRTGAY